MPSRVVVVRREKTHDAVDDDDSKESDVSYGCQPL